MKITESFVLPVSIVIAIVTLMVAYMLIQVGATIFADKYDAVSIDSYSVDGVNRHQGVLAYVQGNGGCGCPGCCGLVQ
jgi:hypothetical protein